MKNIIKSIVTVSMVAMLNSCSLDSIDYPSVVTPEDVIVDSNGAFQAMNGVFYQKLITYRNNYQFVMWGLSDMFVANNRAEVSTIQNRKQFLPNNGQTGWIWTKNYAAIQCANNLMEDIKKIDIAPNIKKIIDGECLFLRAWTYYDLVRLWGGVPLKNDVVFSGSDFSTPRASVDDVYKSIFDDLKLALDNLPTKGELEELSEKTSPENNKKMSFLKYYVSKSAAKAALAHSSLTYANYLDINGRTDEAKVMYQNALDYATEVISDGEYTLCEDFNALYDYNKRDLARKEIMFKATYIGDDTAQGFFPASLYLPTTCGYSSKSTRQVLLMPWYVEQFFEDAYLVDQSNFKDNKYVDPRYSADFIHRWENVNSHKTTIVYPDKGGNEKGIPDNDPVGAYRGFPMVGLYRDISGGSLPTQLSGDFPLLKLDEMYLIQSEAMNEIGGYTHEQIFAPINTLRERARKMTGGDYPKDLDENYLFQYKITPAPAGIAIVDGSDVIPERDDKYAVRRIILKERDLELLGENRRYLDLKRMKGKGDNITMYEYLLGDYYPSIASKYFGDVCAATINQTTGEASWPDVRYSPLPLMLEKNQNNISRLVERDMVKKYLYLPIPDHEFLYNTAIKDNQNPYW